MSPRSANLLLLLAAAVWGMGFVAQDTAMQFVGPLAFVGLRFTLAGLALLPFAIAEQMKSRRQPVGNARGHDASASKHGGRATAHRSRATAHRSRATAHQSPATTQEVSAGKREGGASGRVSWRGLWFFAPVGLVFFIAHATQQVALLQTTVTNSGFLTALYVVFVPLILLLILRQRQAIIIWPAAVLALSGIYLLSGGSLSRLNWGDWLTIVSAGFWAVHVILVGKVAAQSRAPYTLAAAQFFICGFLGLLVHWWVPLPGITEPALTFALIQAAAPQILFGGLIAGGLAFTLQAIAQQYTTEAAAAILLSSESLFAAALGAIMLGERLSPLGYLGGLMIFAAILVIGLWPPPRQPVPLPVVEPTS